VLGRAILHALSNAGIVVRQGLRNPDKARAGMESIRFDYTDSPTFAPALNGVKGLMLMAPPLDSEAPAKLVQ